MGYYIIDSVLAKDAKPCSHVNVFVTVGCLFLPCTAELEQCLMLSSSIKVRHAFGRRSCISTNSRLSVFLRRVAAGVA